jgi:hypothetical protein
VGDGFGSHIIPEREHAKLLAWYTGERNEVERLRQENAELRKRLAVCEAKLKR